MKTKQEMGDDIETAMPLGVASRKMPDYLNLLTQFPL
jgi:hypothetical protein